MISFRGTVLRPSTLHICGEYHHRLGHPFLVLLGTYLYTNRRWFFIFRVWRSW